MAQIDPQWRAQLRNPNTCVCVCVNVCAVSKTGTYNRYWIIDWDPLFCLRSSGHLLRLCNVFECVWVMVNALSLSMLNSALKCRSGRENCSKLPEFHLNVHLLTALLHRQKWLSFFSQEDTKRRDADMM